MYGHSVSGQEWDVLLGMEWNLSGTCMGISALCVLRPGMGRAEEARTRACSEGRSVHLFLHRPQRV